MKNFSIHSKGREITSSLFIIFLSLLLINCNSDDGPYVNTLPIDDSEFLYMVSGKINGESFTYGLRSDANEVQYGVINGISGSCNVDNETTGSKSFSTGIFPYHNEEELSSVIFDFARFYKCESGVNSINLFSSLFPVGTYRIDTDRDVLETFMKAVGITYIPNIGENSVYSTYGTDEDESFFEITSSIEGKEFVFATLQASGMALEGNFNAKLMNEDDPNDIIEITDGTFKLFIRHL